MISRQRKAIGNPKQIKPGVETKITTPRKSFLELGTPKFRFFFKLEDSQGLTRLMMNLEDAGQQKITHKNDR